MTEQVPLPNVSTQKDHAGTTFSPIQKRPD